MPASTPVFGITYPCSGDDIDCTVFETFTQDIQDALNTVDALQVEVLNRPSAKLSFSTLALVAGVSANVVWNVEEYDNDNMIDLAVDNTAMTIRTAGWYLVSASATMDSGPTSFAAAITQNGTVRYRRKNAFPLGNDDPGIQVVGLLECAVADVLRLSALVTGAGTTMTFTSSLSAYMVVPA